MSPAMNMKIKLQFTFGIIMAMCLFVITYQAFWRAVGYLVGIRP